jgi:flagellar protein FliO/FliZ
MAHDAPANFAGSSIPRRAKGLIFMDMTDALRYFGALALVLALVGVAGLAIRRFGLPGIASGAGRRLSVVETLMLGKNHRLFIVRCDGMEHVLVIAPQGASVIASAPVKLVGPQS